MTSRSSAAVRHARMLRIKSRSRIGVGILGTSILSICCFTWGYDRSSTLQNELKTKCYELKTSKTNEKVDFSFWNFLWRTKIDFSVFPRSKPTATISLQKIKLRSQPPLARSTFFLSRLLFFSPTLRESDITGKNVDSHNDNKEENTLMLGKLFNDEKNHG